MSSQIISRWRRAKGLYKQKYIYDISSTSLFQVADSDIDEMFSYADADCDGKINWLEFQTMINPPQGVVQGTSKQGRLVKEKEVTFHPETLSVTSMLRQSQGGRSSRVTPLEFSDTHVSASWSDIGLSVPVTVPEPVPGTRRRF